MRVFATARRFSAPFWKRIQYPTFCELARGNGSIPKIYEDWEYCKMITHELKNNNINQAISILFQSYFNSKTLDIQIYNQVYEKLSSSTLPLSYAEILYTIYRETFPPHALISAWMNKLTYSHSDEFLLRLKKDYQILGEPYPQRPTRAAKREARKQAKAEKEAVNTESEASLNAQKQSKPTKKTVTQTLTSIQLPNIDLPRTDQDLTPEQLFRARLTAEVKEMLAQLSVDISSFTRVVVHNIEVEFDNQIDEQDPPELPSDEEYEFNHEDMPLGLYGLDISKIKIGKIQFYNDKEKDE